MLSAVLFAKKYNIVIVLKSHQTLVTFNGNSYININGNAGLAKAGSGDALSGIITAFLAQGYMPFNAALLGVYIHGLAADITLKNQSMESMLITDVINNLGKAFLTFNK
jgi:NAD(P)H-hydrate epimerase